MTAIFKDIKRRVVMLMTLAYLRRVDAARFAVGPRSKDRIMDEGYELLQACSAQVALCSPPAYCSGVCDTDCPANIPCTSDCSAVVPCPGDGVCPCLFTLS